MIIPLPVIQPIYSSTVNSRPSQRETTEVYFHLRTSHFPRQHTVEETPSTFIKILLTIY